MNDLAPSRRKKIYLYSQRRQVAFEANLLGRARFQAGETGRETE
jgi:hypothetical protein